MPLNSDQSTCPRRARTTPAREAGEARGVEACRRSVHHDATTSPDRARMSSGGTRPLIPSSHPGVVSRRARTPCVLCIRLDSDNGTCVPQPQSSVSHASVASNKTPSECSQERSFACQLQRGDDEHTRSRWMHERTRNTQMSRSTRKRETTNSASRPFAKCGHSASLPRGWPGDGWLALPRTRCT